MTDTVNVTREAWGEYKRSQIAHLRPYIAGEALSERVSISMADLEAGSPKVGDMIARNPENHDDQWLVAAEYFAANFEPAMLAAAPKAEPVDPQALLDGYEIGKRDAVDFGDAILAMLYRYGVKVALDVSEIEALRQSAIRAQPEAPKVEQEHVICHHEAYQGSCAHCGVKIVNGFAVRPKAHPAPASDDLLEAIDMDDFNIIEDWIESGENGSAPSGRVKGLWQSVRRVIAIAKHKGPQS